MEGFTPAQIAQLDAALTKAIRRELGHAGLNLEDTSGVFEARKDFTFMRWLRVLLTGWAARIGWLVIAAFMGAVIWLVALGLNAWRAISGA